MRHRACGDQSRSELLSPSRVISAGRSVAAQRSSSSRTHHTAHVSRRWRTMRRPAGGSCQSWTRASWLTRRSRRTQHSVPCAPRAFGGAARSSTWSSRVPQVRFIAILNILKCFCTNYSHNEPTRTDYFGTVLATTTPPAQKSQRFFFSGLCIFHLWIFLQTLRTSIYCLHGVQLYTPVMKLKRLG